MIGVQLMFDFSAGNLNTTKALTNILESAGSVRCFRAFSLGPTIFVTNQVINIFPQDNLNVHVKIVNACCWVWMITVVSHKATYMKTKYLLNYLSRLSDTCLIRRE